MKIIIEQMKDDLKQAVDVGVTKGVSERIKSYNAGRTDALHKYIYPIEKAMKKIVLEFAAPISMKDEVALFIGSYQEHRRLICQTLDVRVGKDGMQIVYQIEFSYLESNGTPAEYGIFHFGNKFGQRFSEDYMKEQAEISKASRNNSR